MNIEEQVSLFLTDSNVLGLSVLSGIGVFSLLLWTLPWKGYALWRAAQNNHRVWFVVLFLVNTAALLEMIYIFFVDRKQRQSHSKTTP